MSNHKENLVKWDKDKKWEELYFLKRSSHKLEKKSKVSMLVLMVLINLKLVLVISYQRMEAVNKA